MDPAKNKTAIKQNLIIILDEVSSKLGNTRTVCKKYYVHPSILDMYEKGTLQKIISQGATRIKGLSAEESVLMKLLKNLP